MTPTSSNSRSRKLASSSSDKTVRLWDAKTGKSIVTLKGHDGYVESVAFSPDGKLLASGSRDGIVRLWDAKSGKEVATWVGQKFDEVRSLAFSPEPRLKKSSALIVR